MTIAHPPSSPIGLKSGTTSEPLLVLSKSEVRTADLIEHEVEIETADGTVKGRVGDVAVYHNDGERYPILSSIFFGTYEILAKVGNRFVARRLIHIRRAWPVTSDDARFSYAHDRGEIAVRRGSWIYQSDDEDYGSINPDVKHKSHTEICLEKSLKTRDWKALLKRRLLYLAFLPALLTLLALLGFAASLTDGFQWSTTLLLLLEILLLIGGATLVWEINTQRWVLRAAAQDGLRLAEHFQTAVTLLGHRASSQFPGMAIWRAAQEEISNSGLGPAEHLKNDTSALIAKLKGQLGKVLAETSSAIHRNHATEKRAARITLAAIATIVFCNAYLILLAHTFAIELLAIWLPSLIACVHSVVNRRYLVIRVSAMSEFHAELKFLQTRIYALSLDDVYPDKNSYKYDELRSALQALCKTIGLFTQLELQSALADSPELPV